MYLDLRGWLGCWSFSAYFGKWGRTWSLVPDLYMQLPKTNLRGCGVESDDAMLKYGLRECLETCIAVDTSNVLHTTRSHVRIARSLAGAPLRSADGLLDMETPIVVPGWWW